MSRTSSTSGLPGEARTGTARIGCSGWHYKHWRGIVYPEEMPASRWLGAYTQQFSTVELNNSFYRLPAPETFAGWRQQVPRGFVFAVKASRFLTHIKRLKDPDEPLARLLDHARMLGPTLGPILYQIPPRWFPDPERLELFLSSLPSRATPGARQRLHHVMEMRDPRGYEPWVIELLQRYGVTLCVHDMHGSESPLLATAPIVYVRLHGYRKRYDGSYADEALAGWAAWLQQVTADGRDAYVYFNNDMHGHAVRDAARLRAMLAGEPVVGSRDRQPYAATDYVAS